jgi:membrane glycosyltransferase
MGTELTARRHVRSYDTGRVDISPWQDAMPRVYAYLQAAGIDSDRLPAVLVEIQARLQALLPLREHENPVEVALGETAAWVEQQRARTQFRAPAADATPPPEPLDMPEQPIELNGLRRPRRDEPPGGPPPAGPDTGTGPARGIRGRRAAFFSLIAATTAGAIGLLSGSIQHDGLNPLELLLVILYAVLFAWICAAFWTAFIGAIVRLFDIRRWDLDAYVDPGEPASAPRGRTALIMPIYNEEPEYVFARLQAMWESLQATRTADDFDIFVLSDTRDPDIWVEEELRWKKLLDATRAQGRIFYRNRPENTYRKAGNIADFVRTWGGRYRYMAVLDADSLMSGATLERMVTIMEAHPQVAVLQVPAVPVNNSSLFARLLQFGSALYGPLYSAGMNFWQAGDSNYFGHNALIRVEPFARHCGLPTLPGRLPFGGPIMSHDFVEAAMLRRAGWEIWTAHDLGGSFEEIPPTLIDYAKRDRRWCQGNLQHTRLIAAHGWRGLSRLHFSMGVMSYLASPLWFLFLLAAGVEAWLQSQETPVYFFGRSLFPTWPPSYTFELMTVLLVTLSILFMPKVLALALLLGDRRRWREFGGPGRAAASVVLESLFSVLAAPVLMLFQTKFVIAILLRQSIGWPAQQRVDRSTTLPEAMAAHGSHVVLGVVAGVVTWRYVPGFFWWFTPVLAGMLLSPLLSMLTSRADLGLAAARAGLFVTPQEVAPDEVVRRYRELVAGLPREDDVTALEPLWIAALLHPRVHAIHCDMLPAEEPTRHQRHYLLGLMYFLAEQSADALSLEDRRAMISNADCLKRLHVGLWSELSMERLAQMAGRYATA